eukprot:g5161.t1
MDSRDDESSLQELDESALAEMDVILDAEDDNLDNVADETSALAAAGAVAEVFHEVDLSDFGNDVAGVDAPGDFDGVIMNSVDDLEMHEKDSSPADVLGGPSAHVGLAGMKSDDGSQSKGEMTFSEMVSANEKSAASLSNDSSPDSLAAQTGAESPRAENLGADATTSGVAEWRGRLYELASDESGEWNDCGVGYVSVLADGDSHTLQMESEENPGEFLYTSNLKSKARGAFQKTEATIITWNETTTGQELAISFQDPSGCCEVMARINDAVTSSEWPMGNGSPISMHTSIQEFDLPAPRMDNVRDICSAMEGCESSAAAENFFCDERGYAYIDKLLVLFQEAEDLEADDVLGHICLIFCKLINMSCEPIVGHLVSSEKFNIVVGVFEFISLLPQLGSLGAKCAEAARKAARVDHRKFLSEEARHVSIVKITSPEVEEQIHENFRLQYLRDDIGQLASFMTEEARTMITQMILFQNRSIVQFMAQDSHFMPALLEACTRTVGSDLKRRENAWQMLSQLVGLSQSMPMPIRLQLHNALLSAKPAEAVKTTSPVHTLTDNMPTEKSTDASDTSASNASSGSSSSSGGSDHSSDSSSSSSSNNNNSSSSSNNNSSSSSNNNNEKKGEGEDDVPSIRQDAGDDADKVAKEFLGVSSGVTSPGDGKMLFDAVASVVSDPTASCSEVSAAFEILSRAIFADPTNFRNFVIHHGVHPDRAPGASEDDAAAVLPQPLGIIMGQRGGESRWIFQHLFARLLSGTAEDSGVQLQCYEILQNVLNPEDMDMDNRDEFLGVFYDYYVAWLIDALAHDPTGTFPRGMSASNAAAEDASAVDKGHASVSYLLGLRLRPHPTPSCMYTTYSCVVQLLSLCVDLHAYRIKAFVLRNDVVGKVLRLMESDATHIKLIAIRFVRQIVGRCDEHYNTYIVKKNHLEPIMRAFEKNGNRNNMLNSTVLELLKFISEKGIASLIKYVYETFIDADGSSLKNITYVGTISFLCSVYENMSSLDHIGWRIPDAADVASSVAAEPPIGDEYQSARDAVPAQPIASGSRETVAEDKQEDQELLADENAMRAVIQESHNDQHAEREAGLPVEGKDGSEKELGNVSSTVQVGAANVSESAAALNQDGADNSILGKRPHSET